MDDQLRADYDYKATELRASLKKWESDWAGGHNGSKPGRQDIKDNPEIAKQYKEYSKIREILAGKIAPPPKEESTSISQKRKSNTLPAQTPIKRNKYAETPSKRNNHEEDLMNSPAISRKLFSPAPVTSIGPTPQRDGRVLGLFDLLVEKEIGTPSRSAQADRRNTSKLDIQATPSRRRGSMSDESSAMGRTPMSSSKRQLLNTFMTPLKNRKNDAGGKTPSSVSKLQFDTPAFLKRHSLPALSEAAELSAPAPPLRLPRKPLVRGLSEIVASLRQIEEEKLDEELDILREMENEEMGVTTITTATTTATTTTTSKNPPEPMPQVSEQNTAENEDRTVHLLGGLDDEGLYDSADEQQVGRNGLPLPVFKKKGQKRTTRRVNIKPMMKKRPTAPVNATNYDGEDEFVPQANSTGEADGGLEGSDSEEEAANTKGSKKSGGASKQIKKPARKVNELAHANFHRLKLRNNGAKGGPGYNSKFRRRR